MRFLEREKKEKCWKVIKKMMWKREPLEVADVGVSAKMDMNGESAISLLFLIPYKVREQPKHKRIHPKALKGFNHFLFLLYLE